MKIAWLVWEWDTSTDPILVDENDSRLSYCYRKQRIVYAEVIETVS